MSLLRFRSFASAARSVTAASFGGRGRRCLIHFRTQLSRTNAERTNCVLCRAASLHHGPPASFLPPLSCCHPSRIQHASFPRSRSFLRSNYAASSPSPTLSCAPLCQLWPSPANGCRNTAEGVAWSAADTTEPASRPASQPASQPLSRPASLLLFPLRILTLASFALAPFRESVGRGRV